MDRRGHEPLREPPPAGHVPALDGLRGLAILLVLAHHFNILNPAGPAERSLILLFDLGKHGVDLFFVLSGFLITGILLDTRGRPGWLGSFFARRALRIVPLYYALLVALLLVQPLWLARDPATLSASMRWSAEAADGPWYWLFASNILFAIREGFGLQGLDVTWSLAIEEQFYLAWAFLVLFLDRRAMIVACAALIAAGPLVRLVIGLTGGSWLDAYLLTPGRLDALAMGSLLAALYRSPDGAMRRRLPHLAGWVAAVAVSGLLFIQLGRGLNGFTLPGVVIGLTLVGALSAALLAATVELPPTSRWHGIIAHPVLRFFGRYSYGMYLLHMPVRNVVRGWLFPHTPHLTTAGALLFGQQALFALVATVVLCLVAVLVYHAWERPFLSLKRFVPRPQAPADVSNSPS